MFLSTFFVHKINKICRVIVQIESKDSINYFFPNKFQSVFLIIFPSNFNHFYLINSFYDGSIEVVSFSEERVERDLADLRPHGRLGKLGDGELRVLDSVAGLVRVLNSKVQHAVDVQGHVVWKKTK